jgi:hypothetical protein
MKRSKRPSKPALELARRLAALPEPAMREHVLLEYLRGTAHDQAAPVLHEIYLFGREGGPPFNIALLCIASTLSKEILGYAATTGLYEAAKAQRLEALTELFLSNQPGPMPFARREEQLELTLGHRKWMARTTDRDVLQRLLANPEPEVVHNLLFNPRITEQDVVLLAARRPAYGEVQFEIFGSHRWIRRYNVKRALVLNPYTPSDIALRLVSFLNRSDLRLVVSSPTLGAALRQAAGRLLEQPDEQPDEQPEDAE